MRKKLVGRIGEEKMAGCGILMKIKDYRYNNDFDVEFEDGIIVTCKRYRSFVDGYISYPNLKSGAKIGNVRIIKKVLTRRDEETNEVKLVLWHCRCERCGAEGMINPQVILRHKCK